MADLTSLVHSFDLYVDDALDPQQRTAFSRRLGEDPALRAVMALQSSIDASLRRQFTAPSSTAISALFAAPRIAISPRAHFAGSWRRYLAAAAGIAAMLCGTWLLWSALRPKAQTTQFVYAQPATTLETAYGAIVNADLRPDWICESDDQFRDMFQANQGQPLQLRPIPGGVAPLGVRNVFIEHLSPMTLGVLFRIEQQPVIVFIDRLPNNFRTPELPVGQGLFSHRREVGGLVLYELSPFQSPRTLEYFYNPRAVGD